MWRPGYLTLPIFSVLAEIGYVYYTTVFVAGWLGLATAAGVANAAAFTAIAAACLATYSAAVSRDPGRVPPAFLPDVEDAEIPVHEVKRTGRAVHDAAVLAFSARAATFHLPDVFARAGRRLGCGSASEERCSASVCRFPLVFLDGVATRGRERPMRKKDGETKSLLGVMYSGARDDFL